MTVFLVCVAFSLPPSLSLRALFSLSNLFCGQQQQRRRQHKHNTTYFFPFHFSISFPPYFSIPFLAPHHSLLLSPSLFHRDNAGKSHVKSAHKKSFGMMIVKMRLEEKSEKVKGRERRGREEGELKVVLWKFELNLFGELFRSSLSFTTVFLT